MTEADACREFVTPKRVEAGWGAAESVIGEQHGFTNGRIIVAGGKVRRGKQRRADCLRTLLIQGAKSSVTTAHKRRSRTSQWLVQLTARVGWQKAVVAMANKNARILWAVLAKGRCFDPDHVSV